MSVHVIRHGETAWSRGGRHTGLTDLPLTEAGEAQAHRLAPWLADTHFGLVLCSPLLRARQTCDGAGLSQRRSIDPDLAEWDYGDYEGLRSDEIAHGRAGWDVFADGCPGGETPAQVGARADRVIATCAAAPGEAALFTHGEFASVLAVRWIGLPVAAGAHFCLGPAALAVLGCRPGHPAVAAILTWNVVPGAVPPARA